MQIKSLLLSSRAYPLQEGINLCVTDCDQGMSIEARGIGNPGDYVGQGPCRVLLKVEVEV
jgi:hypothetical protein